MKFSELKAGYFVVVDKEQPDRPQQLLAKDIRGNVRTGIDWQPFSGVDITPDTEVIAVTVRK